MKEIYGFSGTLKVYENFIFEMNNSDNLNNYVSFSLNFNYFSKLDNHILIDHNKLVQI